MKKTAEPRSHEHVLDIAASPEEVWKAVTEAEELVRWFPLEAESKPGPGGEITYKWGEFAGTCKILEWSPPHHLRTAWMEAPSGSSSPASPLVVDWYLEGEKGKTKLRLVHSGFGPGADWDLCPYGSDCADCGPRPVLNGPS